MAPDWRTRLLTTLTNPNIAYLLLMLGTWGLILEFAHPGTVLPGTVGAISLPAAELERTRQIAADITVELRAAARGEK
mgnify:CR=1 FL=1